MLSEPAKREIIKGYKGPRQVFIETGTCLGDTVESLKNDFDRVVSIELSDELAARARRRFRSDANVTIVQGDSSTELRRLLERLTEPALFWLDAHYSSGWFVGEEFIRTARGAKITPIREELAVILSHAVKDHVVLIDDARCFVGMHDYPDMKELKRLIRAHRPDMQVTVKRDIIRITPGPRNEAS